MQIYKKIPILMREIGAIGKDMTNKHQGYNFRGIDQMYDCIQPHLIAHGVFVVPQVIAREAMHFTKDDGKVTFRVLLTVNHKFCAEDGSYIEVITSGEGIDTSDKASNKAMSAAMKYAFIELFSIPTSSVDDADRDHIEVNFGAKAEAPKKLKQSAFKRS